MPQDIHLIFGKLMASGGIDGRSDEVALNRIGTLIDVATDLGREEGITMALAWSDELACHPLSDADATLLEYFRANAWEARKLQKHRDDTALWNWEQPEAQQQILHLRKAIRHPGYQKLDSVRQCQIQTNLGNQLSHIGRFVESLPRWEGALAIRPRFGMALGNRGYGLKQYGHALYDPGHAQVFFATAHAQFSAALAREAEFEGYDQDQIKVRFAELLSEIEEHVDVEAVRASIKLEGYDLGESTGEQAYRRWVLDERLFLNPLNDLGPYTIAARDILSLPSYTTPIGEPPTLIGFFNQMKQEFVSARWFLYECIQSDEPHFSDRDVTLYNTLDYPSYALAVERGKAAYRIAYSLFDKIAFFLNDYAKLGVHLKGVYFRTVWYTGQDAKRGVIRDELVKMQNWPLRGLFWLAKDLFDPDLQDSAEPEAQELYVIRNCLEHSYLKVHEMLPSPSDTHDPFRDRLAHSVQREAFIAKTLLVLRRARAALIYLSLGMHQEEKRRAAGEKDGLIAPMHLDHWDDDWKS
jgi:hypothetical protein